DFFGRKAATTGNSDVPPAAAPKNPPASEGGLKFSLTSEIPAAVGNSTPAFVTEPAPIPAAQDAPLELAMPAPSTASPAMKRPESGIVVPTTPEFFGLKAMKTANSEAPPTAASTNTPASAWEPKLSPTNEIPG